VPGSWDFGKRDLGFSSLGYKRDFGWKESYCKGEECLKGHQLKDKREKRKKSGTKSAAKWR